MAQSTPGPSRKRSSFFTPPPPSSAQSGPFHSPLSPVQPLSSPLAAFLGSAAFPPSVPYSPVPRVRRRPVKKKRFNTRLLYSILYQTSFYFFIVVIAALLVGSVWGLGDQAWKTADARRWNIVILVAAYLALVSWRPLSNQTVPSCRFRRFPRDIISPCVDMCRGSSRSYISGVAYCRSRRSYGPCPSRTCLPSRSTFQR